MKGKGFLSQFVLSTKEHKGCLIDSTKVEMIEGSVWHLENMSITISKH